MVLSNIGFPAQQRQAAIERQISLLRDRINATTDEAVTGRLSDVAPARDGRVAEVYELGKSLEDLSSYNEIIALSQFRATSIQASLDQIRGLSIELMNSAQTTLSAHGQSPLEIVSQNARQTLGAAISALNVSFGGRSLFAGDASDRGAITDIDSFLNVTTPLLTVAPDADTAYATIEAAFADPGGLFETTLYTGGTGDAPSTEIAPGERVDYALRADADGLRAVLRDFAVLAAAFDETNAIPDDIRRDLADRAVTGLRNATDEISILSATIGTAEQRIADIKSRNVAEETALTLSYNEIAGRDQFEAVAELESLEGQLESLFLTTARLSNLSLVNFLR